MKEKDIINLNLIYEDMYNVRQASNISREAINAQTDYKNRIIFPFLEYVMPKGKTYILNSLTNVPNGQNVVNILTQIQQILTSWIDNKSGTVTDLRTFCNQKRINMVNLIIQGIQSLQTLDQMALKSDPRLNASIIRVRDLLTNMKARM